MDLMTIIGFIFGAAAVVYVMYAGKILHLLFDLNAAILVFGGTFACILITYPWALIKKIPRAILLVIFPSRKHSSAEETINLLMGLSERAKKQGIETLRDDLKNIRDNFLAEALELVIDGYESEIIRDRMEKELLSVRRRHLQLSGVFKSMGSYAPIFGLLGTLIGVVQVLRDLTDPKSMGASMAIAVTTTFYGIFGTNFIFLPISGKLNAYSEEEVLVKEVIIKGVLSIQKGDVPIVMKKKLEAFMAYNIRTKA